MKSVTWNELSPWVKVFLFAGSRSNILALNPKMCLLLGRTFADDPLYFLLSICNSSRRTTTHITHGDSKFL